MCLTVEQAKELKELGFDLKDTIMVYCNFNDQNNDYKLMINHDVAELGACEVIPTLTNTEMIDMLPSEIKTELGNAIFKISKYSNDDEFKDIKYYVSYEIYIKDTVCYKAYFKPLLRDTLFEMIKIHYYNDE